AVWLIASASAMMAALLASLSRSGLTGGAVAVLGFIACSHRRMASKGRAWLLLGMAAMLVVAAMYANIDAMMSRLNDGLGNGVGGRRAIWEATRHMVADFPVIGVGVGAYERAMTVYQPPPRLFGFNHAHNEYLQIVAEGGIVLGAAVLVVLGVGAWQTIA